MFEVNWETLASLRHFWPTLRFENLLWKWSLVLVAWQCVMLFKWKYFNVLKKSVSMLQRLKNLYAIINAGYAVIHELGYGIFYSLQWYYKVFYYSDITFVPTGLFCNNALIPSDKFTMMRGLCVCIRCL